MQAVHDDEVRLADWWNRNYEHVPRARALDNFERRAQFFEYERGVAKTLVENRGSLREKVREGRVFLNVADMDRIDAYVALGEFHWAHDGIGMDDDYWEEFFGNLLDNDKSRERERLFAQVKARLGRMHKL